MIQDGFFAALKAAAVEAGSRKFFKLDGDVTSLDVGFSPAPAILPIWLRRGFDNQRQLRLAHVSAGDSAKLEDWLAVAKLNWFRVGENGAMYVWESPDEELESAILSDLGHVHRLVNEPKAQAVEEPAIHRGLGSVNPPDLAGAGDAMRRISGQGSQSLEDSPQDSDEPSAGEVQAGLREIVFITQGAVPKKVKAFVLNDMGEILNVHVPPGQPLQSREYSIKKSSLI